MRYFKLLLLLSLIFVLLSPLTVEASSIKVFVDQKEVTFYNGNPYIDRNNRTMVPIRFPAEALGANVTWDGVKQQVTITKDQTVAIFTVNKRDYLVNGKVLQMDTEMVFNREQGRNYVPLRFVVEAFGATISWERISNVSEIRVFSKDFGSITVHGISMGDTVEKVIATLGSPNRIDPSIYDFQWYIYNSNYMKYAKIGIKNNRVVSMVNMTDLTGYTFDSIQALYGQPIDVLRIDGKGYIVTKGDPKELDMFVRGDTIVYVYYDIYDANRIQGIALLDKSSRVSLDGFVRKSGSVELEDALSRQIFELANAMRVQRGLPAFVWDAKIAVTAKNHSIDMGKNNYFDHNNLQGLTPFDRIRNDGILYRSAGENIAAGYEDALAAHAAWMNSWGHRQALLGNYTHLGVGTAFTTIGSMGTYYTQKFFTPR